MAPGGRPDDPRMFSSQAVFRTWLERHHDLAAELWVGFWNKASGKKGMTYAEAVDEALCWGWIDGIKKNVDAERYTNRFTPRKPVSKWSDVNLRRYAEMEAAGRVAAPGKAAFARFDPAKREDTRLRRLAQLVEVSAAGERVLELGGGAARRRQT